MTATFKKFPSWSNRLSQPKTSCSSGASGEDGGEFGLDFPVESWTGVSDSQAPSKDHLGARSYGSVNARKHLESLAEKTAKAHSGLQRIAAAIAVLWIISIVGHRILAILQPQQGARPGAPAPAPGATLMTPTCATYTYPQCEAALRWYLSNGARSRCEAFERVKAEGDLLKFPYSATSQDTCQDPGCCGCAGQCSKCPPLLPECTSWQLDGFWKVAFGDGTETKYTFDAHGHCEVELSADALPKVWKEYDQAYIAMGSDAMQGQWLTLASAKKQCEVNAACRGITYDSATRKGETYFTYLKTTAALAPGPGTSWKTMIEETRPELHGSAAIAGPLTRVSSDSSGTFRLNLHKAAPQLFPLGSMERLSVVGEELLVERRIAGTKMLAGVGVRTK